MRFEKGVYYGTQDEIAEKVVTWLFCTSTQKNVSAMVAFMKAQRAIGNAVFTWRGIGIDATPRKCKCWIEGGEDFARWLRKGERTITA